MLIDRTTVDSVVTTGYARLEGLVPEEVCSELRKPDEHEWRAVAPRVGVVDQNGWFLQMRLSEAPDSVREVAQAIRKAMASVSLPDLPAFNEVSWQRYEPGRGFIAPHRDQAFYIGVIAIINLTGTAEFAVLRSREPPVVLERWLTGTGDLVLLRGAELAGPGSRGPLHSVGPPESERFSLSFRHDVRGPGGWAEA